MQKKLEEAGSNDLCQYLTAADRMNSSVAKYCRSSHPALYRAIALTIRAFQKENKPLSICGEFGGDKNAACVLVGMGLRKLSMSMHAVPMVKQALSRYDLPYLETLAEAVLECADADEVELCMNQFLHS